MRPGATGPRAPAPRRSSQAEFPHAELVRPEVVGELVANGAGDLRAQLVGVVAEVASGVSRKITMRSW